MKKSANRTTLHYDEHMNVCCLTCNLLLSDYDHKLVRYIFLQEPIDPTKIHEHNNNPQENIITYLAFLWIQGLNHDALHDKHSSRYKDYLIAIKTLKPNDNIRPTK